MKSITVISAVATVLGALATTSAHAQTGGLPALQSDLNTEISRAEAAEVTEAAARQGSDAQLQQNIDAEGAARVNADAALQDSITQGDSAALAAAKAYADTRPGPQGPAGPPGVGVMATWSWFPNESTYQPIHVESGPERKRIIAVTIPQDGIYLLFATMRYAIPGEWAFIVCDIVDSRNPYYTEAIANAAAPPGLPGIMMGTMTLHTGYWFPAGMVVEAVCSVETPTQVTAQFDMLQISAILVNDFRAGTPAQ